MTSPTDHVEKPCLLDGCPGMNADGSCPNGYGITCESVFPEPSNMDDWAGPHPGDNTVLGV